MDDERTDAVPGPVVEPRGERPGDDDGLDRLWTPHRMVYIGGQDKPADDSAGQCPFCRIQGLPDADGLVVARGATAYVVLNLYPYNPGHLMVVPYRHVSDYTDLTEAETVEVHTCPVPFLREVEFTIEVGNRVTVVGSRPAGGPVIVAREIRKGQESLVLRDAKGAPNWIRR